MLTWLVEAIQFTFFSLGVLALGWSVFPAWRMLLEPNEHISRKWDQEILLLSNQKDIPTREPGEINDREESYTESQRQDSILSKAKLSPVHTARVVRYWIRHPS